jgi:hypothetical protein
MESIPEWLIYADSATQGGPADFRCHSPAERVLAGEIPLSGGSAKCHSSC